MLAPLCPTIQFSLLLLSFGGTLLAVHSSKDSQTGAITADNNTHTHTLAVTEAGFRRKYLLKRRLLAAGLHFGLDETRRDSRARNTTRLGQTNELEC